MYRRCSVEPRCCGAAPSSGKPQSVAGKHILYNSFRRDSLTGLPNLILPLPFLRVRFGAAIFQIDKNYFLTSSLRTFWRLKALQKWWKMLFISPQKLFLFSKYLNFVLIFCSCNKINTVVIHILPNISRNKSNQTMELGQLIEYNMRNIILKKSYTKCGGETSPIFFSGKLKLSISLDQ